MEFAHLNLNLVRVFQSIQLSTSIADAECAELSANPADSYARLSRLRFDQAPVADGPHIVGWVATGHLQAAPSVQAVFTPLHRAAIVSAETPIEDLLEQLGQDGFVFVVGDQGVTGFITPSDLDRHAARSHFYLLIAAIEMLLAGLVGAAVDPATVAKAIRSGGDARRWAKAKKANIDTNPVEYLYLKELVELFEDHHLARSGEWSQQLNDSLHAVVKVRNPVMHPTGSLVMGRDAREIARTARAALDVAHALTEIARIRGSDNSKPPGGGFVE